MNIIGPVTTYTGYGVATNNITNALCKYIPRISLFPINDKWDCEKQHFENIKQCISNGDLYDLDKPCLRIWHQYELSMFVGKGQHIGMPIFELDSFTKREEHHLKCCDKLFVCSNWAKNIIYEKTGHKNIHIVPLGVDTEIFSPKESRRDSFIFLNVGKWEKRKGHDILPYCFDNAFDYSSNVELWMMPHNWFLNNDELETYLQPYKNMKLYDKVRILPRVSSHQELANIMQQADVGIFPARAEGFNLELLEMMSCGKKVITTNYSAHTEYCNSDNSLLVDIDELEFAFDNKWFNGQGRWARLMPKQIDQIVNYMRQCFYDGRSINNAGIETAQKMSWNHTAERIVNALEN